MSDPGKDSAHQEEEDSSDDVADAGEDDEGVRPLTDVIKVFRP
jgi:hypothetical protein